MDRLTKFTLQVLAKEKLDGLLELLLADLLEVSDGSEGSVYLLSEGEYQQVHSTPIQNQKNKNEEKLLAFLRLKKVPRDSKKAHIFTYSEPTYFGNNLVLPLKYQHRHLGAVILIRESKEELSSEKLQRIKLMGSIATLAIKNLQLSSKVSKALKKRELFIATAAHELRTPLSVISSYNQIVKKKMLQGKPIKETWVKSIARNSKKLEFLITDLFSTARISSGLFTYHKKRIDVSKLLKKTVKDLSMIYEQKITTQFDFEPVFITADRSKLAILFSNLITNACKYSPADSTVTVILSKKKNALNISVVDAGKGIKAQDIKKVFKKNYQGSDSKGSGLGLGLFLCKKITEGHDGSIKVVSKKNKGTTVTVILPIN